MSIGASKRKENPLSGSINWKEEIPKSIKIPSNEPGDVYLSKSLKDES
jgi:hypothetical protein